MVALRNLLFDAGILGTRKAGVPVISVGNITVGGSGKTPMTMHIAGWLRDRGLRVAVLSRGYRRRSSGYLVVSNGRQRCADAIAGGDEPALMAETLQGVIVAVDERRARGAEFLTRDFRPDVIVLDDGFQHRFLGRTLDVVLLPVPELLGRRRLLPAGTWREPLRNVRRANLVALSEWRDEDELAQAARLLEEYGHNHSVAFRIEATGLRRFLTNDAAARPGGRVMTMCAIANPDRFSRTLSAFGIEPVGGVVFEDHHWFTAEDLRTIATKAKGFGAEVVVTTAKDAVRLETVPGAAELDRTIPILVLDTAVRIIRGETLLYERLEQSTCR